MTRPTVETDAPARTDPFLRGLSEAIGGPLGDHAAPRGPGSGRVWTAARIVLALACLTLVLHWVQKSPCEDGAWQNLSQYKNFCYTDVLALYYSERLHEGAVPYVDHPVEYPVLTGAFMGLLGLPVHSLGVDNPGLNQGMWFYRVNALALGALAIATCAMILSLRRRRPWDAALFAVAPALFVTTTVNWDFLAIALGVGGLVAWARRYPIVAGVLFGLGAAAKLWPAFLFIPLFFLCLRARRMADWLGAAAAGFGVWLLVNLPVAIAYPESWLRFFRLSSERIIDWGTLWYIGDHFPHFDGQYGIPPFQRLSQNIPLLNNLTYILFGLAWLGIGLLTLYAPRRPRLGQVVFLTIATFLIFNKVWSQQFVLWLVPLAVLARPRWGAFLAWQAAEILYFLAFYAELMGASGKPVIPEGYFVLAAGLRLITLAVLCGFVVRDILRPELDAVRQSYPDDPDGGILDGLDDPPWTRPRALLAARAGAPADMS